MIHALYLRMTSSRFPSTPITNGLPHFVGRATLPVLAGIRQPLIPRLSRTLRGLVMTGLFPSLEVLALPVAIVVRRAY